MKGRRALLSILMLALLATSAPALHVIDFEQAYYLHPDWQVWDFCLVKNGNLYVMFYGALPQDEVDPALSDDIWRSTSLDLIHWTPPLPVLSTSQLPHEEGAVWAPDVVWDETTGLWWMAYTGVDAARNQRICMAYSSNLVEWQKSPLNPIIEPAPPEFVYNPDGQWSECRDPFLFRADDQWHVLSSVIVPGASGNQGALAVSSAITLHAWTDPEVFFLNESTNPAAALESSQYLVRDGQHHLFFHQYGLGGVSHLVASDPASWDFANRTIVDLGIAPEVDSFDDGASWIYSRVAPYIDPLFEEPGFVVRLDTLQFQPGPESPEVLRRPPLGREFSEYVGNIVLGNPTFGDNPKRRGEPEVGHLGRCYFGSAEYFQGPLSGRGQAGQMLGDSATGYLKSHPFVITGNSISLLVGGTDHPEECYVALMDAAADTILCRASGDGEVTMTERWWDTVPYFNREVYIYIQDMAVDGHLNVDHIKETLTMLGVGDGAAGPPATLLDHGPRPNPANPMVSLSFTSPQATRGEIAVHDLRGRLVWRRSLRAIQAGINQVTWPGCDQRGIRVAGGVYVYRIRTVSGAALSGKVTVAP